MRLYLASGNAHKARELQELADARRASGAPGPVLEVLAASVLGGMPEVDEDTGTFLGNARKKARALRTKVPADAWALADDSGICVEALGGAPGVESAYFAGAQCDPAANLAKLIQVMAEVPDGRRGAEYVCVLLLLGPDGAEHAFEGRCAGTLARDPRGQGGFGYDPLFVPAGYSQTLGELPAGTKHGLSHRGRAWEQCAAFCRGAAP
jgi:XTP/dITP diphosphohydrolase